MSHKFTVHPVLFPFINHGLPRPKNGCRSIIRINSFELVGVTRSSNKRLASRPAANASSDMRTVPRRSL
jgi:hypothetical protein